MGLTAWHRQQQERGRAYRTEARRLKAEGLSVKEIARRLNRSPLTVHDYLWKACPVAHERPEEVHLTWKEKAEAMAAAYPDEERRRWILKRMGVAEEEAQ